MSSPIENMREFAPSRLSKSHLLLLCETIESGQAAGGTLEACRRLRELADLQPEERNSGTLQLGVSASLLADLVEQEWRVIVSGEKIFVMPTDWKDHIAADGFSTKLRIRESLQVTSNRQLATESVTEFVRTMQRQRVHRGKITSVNSLIDSGVELVDLLQPMRLLDAKAREAALEKNFKPYVQLCSDEEVCEHTGLPLLGVWRYFRHTWSLEYNPLPGRTMRFLVRNRARANHPVIGIAMLASPPANLYIRDSWLGWRLDDILKGLLDGQLNAKRVAVALLNVINEAIGDIRTDDLLKKKDIRQPTEEVFFRLRQIAGLAHHQRRSDLQQLTDFGPDEEGKIVDIRNFDKSKIKARDWKKLSGTPLFVKKRAEQLIPLLRAYKTFVEFDFDKHPQAGLYEALVTRHGKEAVSTALGELRKRKIATEIGDLAVCGAVAPYNELIGGKLVTLLMSSEEVRALYNVRYGAQESEIASQMAGRPIVRPAHLRVLTTTSLYGMGSSQYNRLAISAASGKAIRKLRWEDIGVSQGVTITHVSKTTSRLMRRLGHVAYGTHRINSVFGEGSSPRTRQIREGLNLIGINDNSVLEQTVGRRVYACELYDGAKRDLTGFYPQTKSAKALPIKTIARAWIQRWLRDRVLNVDVMERLGGLDRDCIAEQFKIRILKGKVEIAEEEIDVDQIKLELG